MKNKQTILIAGATGNIGKAAAVSLAKRGTRVVVLGRSGDKLRTKADLIRGELTEAGADFRAEDIETLEIDFSDMESVRLAAAEAMKRFPVINGLILSVARYIQGGPNILANGHELMFATNVMGPFLLTQLLMKRLREAEGVVLHVIALFREKIDWDDLESIKSHRTMPAFNRTKVFNRVIAGELARQYVGEISSVAYDPTYVIDKSDPDLDKRWPKGFWGFIWKIMTLLFAKSPTIAGEPIADLMLEHKDRGTLNGALFKLGKRIEKPEKAMNDKTMGKRLWEELERRTGLDPNDES